MIALEFSSVMVLENALIDSALTKKARKKYLKLIKELQEESKDDAEVINKFIKTISQKKTNIFGAI